MTHHPTRHPTRHAAPPAAPSGRRDARSARLPLLEAAADAAVRAPSVHDTQPWRIVLHPDRLELFADRTRHLAALDPLGRALTQSVGAALFDARVAVAAAGRAARVDRLPDPADPGLLAVLRPVDGPADPALAALGPAVPRRRTDRRHYAPGRVPGDLLEALVAAAAAEDTTLVPVTRDEHVRLLARLTQQADGIRNADPDTAGAGLLPPGTDPGTGQTLVVLATAGDDPSSWLRCGEALERVLLELATHGWVAGPLTQAVEVPVTRTQLRSALTWHGHPQSVLRIGRAPGTSPTPRRPRATVGGNSAAPVGSPVRRRPGPPSRPVPDGRGGTTWV